MYLYNKLTLMAALLLQFAFLTQSRHITRRSTTGGDEVVCSSNNVTKNVAACFLSKALTTRLDSMTESLQTERERESRLVQTLPGNRSFYTWQGHKSRQDGCPSNTWAISYLLAEATSDFEEDEFSVRRRTTPRTDSMKNLRIPVKSLLTDLYCEVKSMLENCPLLSGYPISDISTDPVGEQQPWNEDSDPDFIAAKFWVVWYYKMHCISGKARQLAAVEITDTERSDCSHTLCVA